MHLYGYRLHLNDFLGHDKNESEYFFCLVQLARAGTQKLKTRFQEQQTQLLNRRALLRERIEIKERLTELDQLKYYSAWYYAAIHILVTIPNFQTKAKICERLNLNLETVTNALTFLVESGLVAQDGQSFLPGVVRLFLGGDSPMISKHHTNWRVRAIDSLDKGVETDLHYSTVISISKTDASAIKEHLMKSVETARSTIKVSKEEELLCLNLDFFRI